MTERERENCSLLSKWCCRHVDNSYLLNGFSQSIILSIELLIKVQSTAGVKGEIKTGSKGTNLIINNSKAIS